MANTYFFGSLFILALILCSISIVLIVRRILYYVADELVKNVTQAFNMIFNRLLTEFFRKLKENPDETGTIEDQRKWKQ